MQKTARLQARCYASERRALEALIQLEGRSASDILRDAIRDRAQRAGVWPVPAHGGGRAHAHRTEALAA